MITVKLEVDLYDRAVNLVGATQYDRPFCHKLNPNVLALLLDSRTHASGILFAGSGKAIDHIVIARLVGKRMVSRHFRRYYEIDFKMSESDFLYHYATWEREYQGDDVDSTDE